MITADELDWPDPKIVFVNEAMCRITGYAAEELIGRTPRILHGQQTDRAKLEHIQAELNAGRSCLAELVHYRHDGTAYDTELFVTPLYDAQNCRTNFVSIHRDISEIKLAESALQLEHALSENIIETSQVIVLVLDPDGRIVRFNRYMEELTGWRLDEVRGRDWFEAFLPAGDRAAFRAVFQRALGGERTRGDVSAVVIKDGTLREIEWFNAPLGDGEGRCIGLLCTGKDITEQKQEERYRDAQYKLTRVLAEAESIESAVPEALRIICQGLGWQFGEMWRHDPQYDAFRCEFVWHDGAPDLVHFEAVTRETVFRPGNSLIGRTWSRAKPVWLLDVGEDPDFYRHSAVKAAGLHATFAFPILSNGQVIGAFAFFANQLRQPDAKLLDRMEVFGKQVGDFIHRKRAEEALHDSEAQMRAILNTAADAILTIDQSGIVTAVNPATEEMFGYPRAELVGRNAALLMPPPYRGEYHDYFARYLRSADARVIGPGREVVGRRKDGSTFPVELAISQVGHLDLFTAIVRDISHRKNLERQVLEIAAEEQRRIGQELHDGTGQELTGLALFAGTLVELLNQAPQRATGEANQWRIDEAQLQRLRHTASRLSQGLVEANQHVQQLSHGIMPVQIEVEGLRTALEQLAATTHAQQNVSCRFDCPVSVGVANNTTATHLYRIAQEAVNNALRHGRADEIRISLARADGEIILEVSDNGIGFDPPAVERSGAWRGTGGFGLGIMSYRAGVIGGQLRVARRDEGGMLVRCTAPVGDRRR